MAPGDDAACEVQSAPSKRHIVATSQYAVRDATRVRAWWCSAPHRIQASHVVVNLDKGTIYLLIKSIGKYLFINVGYLHLMHLKPT